MGLVKGLLHFHRWFHMGQKLVLEHQRPHGAGVWLAAPRISSAELLGVTRCHESSLPLGTMKWKIHRGLCA